MAPAKFSSPQAIYVALLRGINLGGKHLVPMTQLAEIFQAAGCSQVRTYIQSGNVVFRAPCSRAARLPALLAAGIQQRFGFPVPIVLRDRQQIARTVAANPFLRDELPEKSLHVYFLQDEPSADRLQALDAQRGLPDKFHAAGGEIYLYLPNGMARTKMTCAYVDSRLSTVSTARNWTTVLKIREMMES